MKKLLANAISLQMLAGDCTLKCTKVASYTDPEERSVIGHPDLAAILGVPYNRETVAGLTAGDMVHVVQVTGGRLPEGCTALPSGVRLDHWKITVEYPG